MGWIHVIQNRKRRHNIITASGQGQCLKVSIYAKNDMHTDAKYSGQGECIKVSLYVNTCIMMQSTVTRPVLQGESISEERHAY
jgi:hypothetical protein